MSSFNTKIFDSTHKSIAQCAELLKIGEVCAIPTETVYGLAGNALNPYAIKKIFEAKGRPSDNPLIVHIADIEMLKVLAKDIPTIAFKLAKEFWPGPLTMVLKKNSIIPDETSGGLDTVGIRMPSHKTARDIIRACGLPLAAPSANSSGKPSPTTAKHVLDDLNGKIPAIIDGGSCAVGVESTVISFENDSIRILRPGFISVADLEQFGTVLIDRGVLEEVSDETRVVSPGMKYKHYSPKANVIIVEGDLAQFNAFVEENSADNSYAVVFDSDCEKVKIPHITYGDTSEEQAKRLFEVLRKLDDIGAKSAYFRCPDKSGIGLAVYNRLLRAAGFEVVKL